MRSSKKGVIVLMSVYSIYFVCIDILGVGDEIPTYEEVVRLDPDPSACRPIVLVGAPGVGRKALIRKLVNSNPSLYQPVLRCKSLGETLPYQIVSIV